jgi:hypothetical protein
MRVIWLGGRIDFLKMRKLRKRNSCSRRRSKRYNRNYKLSKAENNSICYFIYLCIKAMPFQGTTGDTAEMAVNGINLMLIVHSSNRKISSLICKRQVESPMPSSIQKKNKYPVLSTLTTLPLKLNLNHQILNRVKSIT